MQPQTLATSFQLLLPSPRRSRRHPMPTSKSAWQTWSQCTGSFSRPLRRLARWGAPTGGRGGLKKPNSEVLVQRVFPKTTSCGPAGRAGRAADATTWYRPPPPAPRSSSPLPGTKESSFCLLGRAPSQGTPGERGRSRAPHAATGALRAALTVHARVRARSTLAGRPASQGCESKAAGRRPRPLPPPARWNWWTHTFDLTGNEQIMANWVENSARVGYLELQPLLDCIKAAGVNVVLPMNERDNQGSQVRARARRRRAGPRSPLSRSQGLGFGAFGFPPLKGPAAAPPSTPRGGRLPRGQPKRPLLAAQTALGPPRRRPPCPPGAPNATPPLPTRPAQTGPPNSPQSSTPPCSSTRPGRWSRATVRACPPSRSAFGGPMATAPTWWWSTCPVSARCAGWGCVCAPGGTREGEARSPPAVSGRGRTFQGSAWAWQTAEPPLPSTPHKPKSNWLLREEESVICASSRGAGSNTCNILLLLLAPPARLPAHSPCSLPPPARGSSTQPSNRSA
jgi:hypothetical protein